MMTASELSFFQQWLLTFDPKFYVVALIIGVLAVACFGKWGRE